MAAAFAAAAVLLAFRPAWAGAALGGCCAALAVLCLLRRLPGRLRRGALVLGAAAGLACCAVWCFSWRAAAWGRLGGRSLPVTAAVLSAEEGPNYTALVLYARAEGSGLPPTQVRTFVWGTPGWRPGDRAAGVLTFSVPEDTAARRTLYGRGRLADAKAKFLHALPAGAAAPSGPLVWGARLGEALSQGLTDALPGRDGAFAQSLLLGRREELSDQVSEDMRRSGAAHVLVVSGLHLSFLCASVMALLRRAGRWPRFLCGGAVCLAVMGAAGFSPSITRGGIMMLLVLAAQLVGRKSDPLNSLGAAVLLMGAWNPYVFFSWSFLLSVGSVLSILLFTAPLQQRLLGWRRRRFPSAWPADVPLGMLAVALGAMVYSYPLLSVLFGGVALYGLLGNLLLVPLAQLLLPLTCLTAVAGALGARWLARLLAVPTGALASLAQAAAGWIARLPGSWLPVDRPWQLVWLGAAALVCTGLALLRRSGAVRALPVRLCALGLTAALLTGALSAAAADGRRLELRTFTGSRSLLVLDGGQAVLLDADPAGMRQALLLGRRQVLYAFAPDVSSQQAALIVQQASPQAVLAAPATARRIRGFVPESAALLDPAAPVALAPGLAVQQGQGYILLRWGSARILKILPGYDIIEKMRGAADVVVGPDGGITAVQAGLRPENGRGGQVLRLQLKE